MRQKVSGMLSGKSSLQAMLTCYVEFHPLSLMQSDIISDEGIGYRHGALISLNDPNSLPKLYGAIRKTRYGIHIIKVGTITKNG